MTYGPYKISTASLDQTTGEGKALFVDGEELLFTVRTNADGKRFYRLLTPVHRIGVSCPPRFKSVVDWVARNVPTETIVAARAA